MLADSDMSPVYTLPLVLCALVMCYLQVRHPLKGWEKLGKCQKVIQHSPKGGRYGAVAVNSEGLLAVTENENNYIYLLRKGALVRSIGKGLLGIDPVNSDGTDRDSRPAMHGAKLKAIENRMTGGNLGGIAFDLKGNVWVADGGSNKVLKLSQDGRLLQTIHGGREHDIDHAGSKSDHFNHPDGVSVSPAGQVYISDSANHRVTVHDEEGTFRFAFGSKGSGPQFGYPLDVAVGSDGLVYVTNEWNSRICVWSKEGMLQRDFKSKYAPTCIAATGDNHLLITSWDSNTVMVYTLGGQLVHEFGGRGSDPGRFVRPYGICVDDSGAVYVADYGNRRVQVF